MKVFFCENTDVNNWDSESSKADDLNFFRGVGMILMLIVLAVHKVKINNWFIDHKYDWL